MVRIRLTKGVRCAIRMRSQEKDKKAVARKPEHDIRNSVHHVLGNHDNCSDFCTKKPEQSSECVSNGVGGLDTADTIPDVLADQKQARKQAICEEWLRESRFRTKVTGTIDP
ncbi:hypothetical protein KP79_PYT01167 [Mizuhopecten yessoensis]|uniref:Uncharacterized protein n=1 Tax=Mizuhopecten yessoensis TaxID=6573 RepID=A0A210QIM6_MIZYE|nr:hypothetical protein KP79_PYT01167 [Mizuhopecten yessoensis]